MRVVMSKRGKKGVRKSPKVGDERTGAAADFLKKKFGESRLGES